MAYAEKEDACLVVEAAESRTGFMVGRQEQREPRFRKNVSGGAGVERQGVPLSSGGCEAYLPTSADVEAYLFTSTIRKGYLPAFTDYKACLLTSANAEAYLPTSANTEVYLSTSANTKA